MKCAAGRNRQPVLGGDCDKIHCPTLVSETFDLGAVGAVKALDGASADFPSADNYRASYRLLLEQLNVWKPRYQQRQKLPLIKLVYMKRVTFPNFSRIYRPIWRRNDKHTSGPQYPRHFFD